MMTLPATQPNRKQRRAVGAVNRRRLRKVNKLKANTSALWAKVLAFFKGDAEKTKAWFGAANPMLGDVAPAAMIFQGRLAKLARFVETSLIENEAPTIGEQLINVARGREPDGSNPDEVGS